MQTSFSDTGAILKNEVKQVKTNKNPQTLRGYYFEELLSALQKDIRRGNEYEAVFWAVELETFNPTALWNRLRIIASEDIGIANPLASLVIDILEKEYTDARRRENDSYRLFLTHAVLFLARSRKSRIVDDLLNVVYGEIQREDKKLTIPDYALDKHTQRGREMKRGWEHFYTEGNKLSNEAFENPYTEKAKEILDKHNRLKSESKKVTTTLEQQTSLFMQ